MPRTTFLPAFACTLLAMAIGGASAQQADPFQAVVGEPPGDRPLVSESPARAGIIQGVVTDAATGEPLAAVEVVVVGTALRTLTNETGRFVITGVPAGLYSVRAARLGYAEATIENVQVRDDQAVTADLRLRTSALELEGIVVTGLADPTSARRVPFTIGRVSGEDLAVPPTNAVNSIQGKIAGVSTIAPAQPGAGVEIVLRTPTSINKTNTPLIVVDGVILASTFGRSSTDLSSLDIESIEVVKGAAAASLYGSRAANGVIQIRTRRGTGIGSGTRVTVRSELGMSQLNRRIDLSSHHHYLTNAQGQYVDGTGAVVEREDREVRPVDERYLDVPYADPVYDHVDQFFEPGSFNINSVTLAGSSDETNFFASFGNHSIDGVVLDHGGYDRNELRLNLDHRVGANLEFGFSGYHMRSDREELPSGTFLDLVQQAPDVNLLEPDPDGTPYIFEPDPQGVTPNPLYELVTSRDDEDRARTLANTTARWSPVGWFNISGDLSYDRSDRLTSFFFPRGRNTNVASWQQGVVSRGQGLTTAINGSITAQLRGSWNDANGRLTLRALTEQEDYEFFSSQVNGLTVEGVPDLNAGSIPEVGGSTAEIVSRGFFALASMDYKGRYIGDALVRRDGSSLFGPEERWHTYYRLSAAWRMAEEPWWTFDDVNELKLRYSVGTAGGRPSFSDRFETYSFTTGGGLEKSTLGNRFLKPERSTEHEFGVDAIIRDRYSLQLTHARTTTEDQLVLVPLASGFGFSSQWQNAGTVEGNTWEATLEATVIDRTDLRWSLGFIADRSRHTITEFDRRCFRTGTADAFYRCAGETIGTMYGTRFLTGPGELPEGTPADEFQVNDDGLLVWVGPGGDWREQQWGTSSTGLDATYDWGMPILQLDEAGNSAVVEIGDGNPDLNWGLSSDVQWKGLSLYALLSAQVGGDVYNRTNQRMYQYYRSGDTDQAGKAEETKKTTDYYSTLYASNLVNEWFMEDASFLKLREVSLRYTIPAMVLDRIPIMPVDGITLFASGRNLFTWTDYKGYDPEVGSSPVERIDSFVYPQFRTMTAGLEVRF